MLFKEGNPNHEESVLVMTQDKTIIQGRFYADEDDFYTEYGDLIDALGYADMPSITWDYNIKKL
ncbi:MAG: hypothetical protein Unbinned6437contig1000_75 [Prokaryotic dsDNA virus sp.]|nr:MAG: hypothetical protein Unbinned6437contig1000_75 [Prokaryotic dsDNA virus sp.]